MTTVTVLLPVYNAGKFLRPSLERILNQSWQDFELLVIDDASTDESAKIIASYKDKRVRILKNERNLGIAAALNRGLEVASGEWVARCDADDLSHLDRLKKQVKILEREKDVVAVFSRARLIDNHSRLIGWVRTPTSMQAIRWDLCFRNSFVHGSALFHRKFVWEKLSGYRLLPACEDYDLWSRIVRNQGRIFVLKECLIDYRIHANSTMEQVHTKPHLQNREALYRIMKENCRTFLPAVLSEQQMDILCEAWIRPQTADWTVFFATQKEVLSLFMHRKTDFEELQKALIEEDFSLYRKCLQSGCATSFLQALARIAPDRFAALPWIRILGDKLLSTLRGRSPR